MPIASEHQARRRIGRLLTLVAICLLAAVMRLLGPLPGPGDETMLLGFLLLGAFVAGQLAAELRLPRITGYLLVGVLLGPDALALLPARTVEDFRFINGIALTVIALQAGGELRVQRLREGLRTIGAVTACQLLLIPLGIAALVYLGRDLLPFLAGQPGRTVLATALILAVVGIATSPAATIAVISELHARGRTSDTVLGVAVTKDVVVLLLIAAVIPAAAVVAEPGRGFDFHALEEIGVAIVLSLLAGALAGWLMILYLRRVNRQPILVVLALALLIVEVSLMLGLEYILVGMAAGFLIQNRSRLGPRFLEALEANSLPLYALFFGVAGAGLHLTTIPAVWQAVVLLILGRMLLIYLSTSLGLSLSGERTVRPGLAWMGFLAQAGVTLGLANIVRDRFTPWGAEVAVVIVAMIAVNELVGPPLLRHALDRAGEARPQPERAGALARV